MGPLNPGESRCPRLCAQVSVSLVRTRASLCHVVIYLDICWTFRVPHLVIHRVRYWTYGSLGLSENIGYSMFAQLLQGLSHFWTDPDLKKWRSSTKICCHEFSLWQIGAAGYPIHRFQCLLVFFKWVHHHTPAIFFTSGCCNLKW